MPPGFSVTLLEQSSIQQRSLSTSPRQISFWVIPGDMTEQEIRSASKCRLLQLMSAGYDRILLPIWREMQVPVANNGGANAIPVAEHAVLLILAVYKWLPQHDRALRAENGWAMIRYWRCSSCASKTVGIVGFRSYRARRSARCLCGFPDRYPLLRRRSRGSRS